MSEESKLEISQPDEPVYEPHSDRLGRRQSRLERRAARRAVRYGSSGGWIVGILLIALGAIFMMQNAGIFPDFDNWWALFLLIPAVATFASAWSAYQRDGRQWTAAAVTPLVGSLLFLSLAGMLFFDVSLGIFWPLLLIVGGLLILARPRLAG